MTFGTADTDALCKLVRRRAGQPVIVLGGSETDLERAVMAPLLAAGIGRSGHHSTGWLARSRLVLADLDRGWPRWAAGIDAGLLFVDDRLLAATGEPWLLEQLPPTFTRASLETAAAGLHGPAWLTSVADLLVAAVMRLRLPQPQVLTWSGLTVDVCNVHRALTALREETRGDTAGRR